jgi:tRNA threonylcarbamoyladenosine biosynthesis protein TsaB
VRVLALDTATEACSVALLCGDQIITRQAELGRTHARQILDMIDAVLAQSQTSLSALDGIGASIGPGAFTGVRISVAVAQGLAFGAGLAVVPVNTLEALALQAIETTASHVLACLDARMGELYWGCFRADAASGLLPSSAAQVSAPGEVSIPDGPYRGIGRGFAAYPTLAARLGVDVGIEDGRALPHAREMAELAARRLQAGGGIDPADLTPLYLRDKVAFTTVERQARAE